jgi:hypothetical protein
MLDAIKDQITGCSTVRVREPRVSNPRLLANGHSDTICDRLEIPNPLFGDCAQEY